MPDWLLWLIVAVTGIGQALAFALLLFLLMGWAERTFGNRTTIIVHKRKDDQ